MISATASGSRNLPWLLTLTVVASGLLIPMLGGGIWPERRPVLEGLANVILSAIGGMWLPETSHFLVFVPICLMAIAAGVGQKAALNVPLNIRILAAAFFALVCLSLAFSPAKPESLRSIAEWLAYGFTAVGALSVMTRPAGFRWLAGSVVVGIAWVGVQGILEFVQAHDATHRIQANWQPNSLAGLLVAGLFLGLALCATLRGPWRAVALGFVLPIFGALLLTQSKGALLGLAIGLAYVGPALVLRSWRPALAQRWAILSAVIASVAVMSFVAWARTPVRMDGGASAKPAKAGFLLRVVAPGADAAQSLGFRKLLYQSAIELVAEKPLGHGMDSFNLYCSQPGLVTSTTTAHNSFLQLAVEAGPIAALCLLATLLSAILLPFGSRAAEYLPCQAWLQGALFATIADNLLESNLYSFGIGCVVAVVLAGLIFIGSAPKTLQASGFRVSMTIVAGVVVAGLMGYSAYVEVLTSKVKMELEIADAPAARSNAQLLTSVDGIDGAAWSLLAQTDSSPAQSERDWRRAIDREPSQKNFYSLASLLSSQGRTTEAIGVFDQAAVWEPAQMKMWLSRMRIEYSAHRLASARQSGLRILAVEPTSYYRVRALPDFIPTEGFEARVLLADMSADPQVKAEYLRDSVRGFEKYLSRTWPILVQYPFEQFGDDSLQVGYEKLSTALTAAKGWQKLSMASGSASERTEAEDAIRRFQEALKQ